MKQARSRTLERFFHDHNLYRADALQRPLTAINAATALTSDPAIVTPHRLQALALGELLRTALQAIARFDQAIVDLAPKHAHYPLFSSLPGAGPHLTPRLLVAFGEQRERFSNAAEVQKYLGIAPVTERSGRKHWVHWRWQCPTFLRQTFVGWAAQTINKPFWAVAYYRQQREKDCSHTLRHNTSH